MDLVDFTGLMLVGFKGLDVTAFGSWTLKRFSSFGHLLFGLWTCTDDTTKMEVIKLRTYRRLYCFEVDVE